MSNPLATYVEKYLLNPAVTIGADIEDHGNEETLASVTQKISGDEGVEGTTTSISKLRLQNSALLGEGDPRYRGKKILRKDLQDTSTVSHDADLAKYCILEEDSDDDDDDDDDDSVEDFNDEESESSEDVDSERASIRNEKIHHKKNKKTVQNEDPDEDLYLELADDDDDDNEVDEDSENENEDSEEFERDSEVDGDSDDKDTEEEDDDDDENIDYEESNDLNQSSIKTFSSENSEQKLKGLAVKNQCSVFDSLFEIRIAIQKVVSVSNQLPQHDIYNEFLKNKNYPQYKENLLIARKAVKKLIEQILNIQEILLEKNVETKHILNEITSSDDLSYEAAVDEDDDRPSKGKRKMAEFEEKLKKRHKALIPFREDTISKWHDKCKLLGSQNKNKFSSFDIPPSQQIRNILVNKDQLIKRTQLLGVARGNVYKILGKGNADEGIVSNEEYDSEIFDDSDFYSRMLEDLLKSKVALSDDMTEVSRRWIDIQKLRKKAKRNVDAKASKGRKCRFEVMSKLQQYLAPCKSSVMEDDATNRLFSSLFGQSGNVQIPVGK